LEAVAALFSAKQKFSAIFATNDQMAIGAAHGLQMRALKVPEDVSLVGFDDVPTSNYALPPLTTVRQPAYDIGMTAARAVLQLLAGEKPTIQLPAPQLIVRGSTGPIKAPS
jgi:LacI family transcriptional regulator